ncbi:MAG: hypothetical protein CMN31_12730, partial [Sandaracinus sp.]|nr:hypothetical protein [Sandaracinus sp.]
DLGRSLFADRTVVLSAHTEARLREAGCRGLVRIPPSVPALPPMDARARGAARERFGLPREAPVVAYPGDLEFGGGAERMIEALGELPAEAILVMACRRKTDAAAAVEARLRARGEALAPGRVRWVGETDGIHALLGAADVVALPSDDLWAKMDHPLVLLEAMSLERPVVVAAGTPAAELAEGGAARAVEPDAGAVAEAVGALLEDAEAARALGERGRARVLAVHAPARVAAAYERVYDGLLERTER